MSFAFKKHQDLYASDYIERKRALNNYRYFKQRLDDPRNYTTHFKIISNYDGMCYFMKDKLLNKSPDASYYLASSRSYDHLLSITKGAYLLPTAGRMGKIDVSCVLCPNTSINLGGELYEGNYYSVSADVNINSSSSPPVTVESDPPPIPPLNINYPEISQNACNINLYDTYIKSGNIKFNDASYVRKKYSYSHFKFPSTLRQ